MKTCVLIPTYNESKAVGEVVSKVKKEGLDVFVVDDGSTDNTAMIAKENGASVMIHEKNKGKGASLKTGFALALINEYEAVIVMDGDGQHDPKDIKRFIQTAKSTDADLIIGDRMQNAKRMPPIRWLTNKCLSSFISRFCGQEIPDTQCGFRLVKSDLLKKINLVSSKFETESEILIRAGKNKFKMLSIPIRSIYNNEASSIAPFKDAYRFLRLVIKMLFEKKTC